MTALEDCALNATSLLRQGWKELTNMKAANPMNNRSATNASSNSAALNPHTRLVPIKAKDKTREERLQVKSVY
jgi:hypothetical protein